MFYTWTRWLKLPLEQIAIIKQPSLNGLSVVCREFKKSHAGCSCALPVRVVIALAALVLGQIVNWYFNADQIVQLCSDLLAGRVIPARSMTLHYGGKG